MNDVNESATVVAAFGGSVLVSSTMKMPEQALMVALTTLLATEALTNGTAVAEAAPLLKRLATTLSLSGGDLIDAETTQNLATPDPPLIMTMITSNMTIISGKWVDLKSMTYGKIDDFFPDDGVVIPQVTTEQDERLTQSLGQQS